MQNQVVSNALTRPALLQEIVHRKIGGVGPGRDETAGGVLEVLTVGERELRENGAIGGGDRRLSRFGARALGVDDWGGEQQQE